VERHDAIITTLELLPCAEAALRKICEWESEEARSAADVMLRGVADFGFIIALQAMARVSAIFVGVSRHLQTPGMDIIKALADIKFVEDALMSLRVNAVEEFGGIFKEAADMSSKMDILISEPRCATKSVYRATAGCDEQDAESYYRVNMFLHSCPRSLWTNSEKVYVSWTSGASLLGDIS
jgi:hypothetical protein